MKNKAVLSQQIMKMRIASFFLLLLFVFPVITACDEEPASVEITVIDSQDRAIENAKLSIYLAPGNSILEKILYTDNLGKVSWDFDFVATMTVFAAKDNYYGQSVRDTVEFTLVRGEVTPVSLQLTAN